MPAGASSRRLPDGLTAQLRRMGSTFTPSASTATATPLRRFMAGAAGAATAAGASAAAPAAEGTNIVAIYSDPLKPVFQPPSLSRSMPLSLSRTQPDTNTPLRLAPHLAHSVSHPCYQVLSFCLVLSHQVDDLTVRVPCLARFIPRTSIYILNRPSSRYQTSS